MNVCPAVIVPDHRLQEEFFQETVRKVQALYQFDCLRAVQPLTVV
jgi:hypothetical protein